MLLSFVDHYVMLHVRLRYVHLYTGPLPQSGCIVQEATPHFLVTATFPLQL
jgi:hypothetical protein